MVAKHRSRATFCLALVTCMCLTHCSVAFSGIRKLQKPEHPLGEEGRGLKSAKHYKGSKSSTKSNKSEKHVQSYTYYQDTLYSDSSSSTYGRKSDHYYDNSYSKPAQKPVSYYDPNDTSKYDSYSDMIDNYYIYHKDYSDSIDEPIKPSQRPHTFPPNWSEDETETPTKAPTNPPFASMPPSTGQCLVRVGGDQCSSLLETIEPEEDCDCYNFCGGVYLGCCAIGEPCPLSCEVLGAFVAGCSFETTPTMKPTMNPNDTMEPTPAGTSTGTEIPGPTPAPTPTDATSVPTGDIIAIPLEPFTLEYEITFTRPIARSDLVVLGSITNSYLQVYMSGAFQSDSVNLADFVTEYTSFVEDPGSSVVLVTFKSTAFFDPATKELPSRIDLERELELAFQGLALVGYLGRVQALPASNAFSTTSDIFMVENPPTVSTLKSRNFSGVATATAMFAVAIVTSFASFSWYRRRRRQRRIEASDNFFRRASGQDSAKDHNIRLSLDPYEDFPKEEVHLADRTGVSRSSDYEGDETYLYEDDTVDHGYDHSRQ